MQWTDDRQIHIHTILHQNKGDENARGHIGTELNNKAETVLLVEKGQEQRGHQQGFRHAHPCDGLRTVCLPYQ